MDIEYVSLPFFYHFLLQLILFFILYPSQLPVSNSLHLTPVIFSNHCCGILVAAFSRAIKMQRSIKWRIGFGKYNLKKVSLYQKNTNAPICFLDLIVLIFFNTFYIYLLKIIKKSNYAYIS
jgi:hypothetical protein